MTHPKVAIIILNWNGREDTIECLESLKHITYPTYEILLVDNGSTDGSVECFRERYPKMEIIETGKNLGFTGGNNVGFRRAIAKDADYVLLLNNDTVVDPEFLGELVIMAEGDNRIAIAQSKILRFNGEIDNMGMFCDKYGSTASRILKNDDQFNTRNSHFFYPSGACMLINTKMIEDELFDGKLFAYHEDVDIGWQTRLKNQHIVYVQSSICYHKGSSVLKNSHKKTYLIWRNRLRTLIKNYSTPNLLKRLPPAIALGFLMAIIFCVYLRNIKYLTAFFSGILWNIKNLKGTLYERAKIQNSRKVTDAIIESYMVPHSLELMSIYKYFKRID